MKIILSLCTVFFLLAFNACEKSSPPIIQTDLPGTWRGQIDSNMMVIRLSTDEFTLSGEIVWQVGNPSYFANIGNESHLEGDSIFIILTNGYEPPQNIASLRGQITGNAMSGSYHKLHQSVPLSDSGFWTAIKVEE